MILIMVTLQIATALGEPSRLPQLGSDGCEKCRAGGDGINKNNAEYGNFCSMCCIDNSWTRNNAQTYSSPSDGTPTPCDEYFTAVNGRTCQELCSQDETTAKMPACQEKASDNHLNG